jgi:hypothetical protein
MKAGMQVRTRLLQWAQHGRVQWIAAGLWMALISAQALWLPEQREALSEARSESTRAQQQWQALQQRNRAIGSGAAPAVSPIETFRTHFPSTLDNSARAARLLALARRHGLSVQRAEFSHSLDTALGLGRYRVTLPAQGPYRALREFAIEALAADPALQLDLLTLRRADARSATIDAQLQFTLLGRSTSPAGAAAARSRP